MKGDDKMALIPRLMPNYLDNMFDDFFTPTRGDDFSKMKCDIYLKDNDYIMEMDIPGFNKEDVNMEIDDNDYLTISAEKSTSNDSEDDDKNYVRKERSYGRYQRSFYVGDIDKDKIDATFENGILKVVMPKKEAEKSSKRKVEIK
ncbi:MAG: Hsp20/alpha crystallin family protein [Bacilli bacterium]|nr:Hsp20/alpha crystallin family protein [Bacilli bacterium]